MVGLFVICFWQFLSFVFGLLGDAGETDVSGFVSAFKVSRFRCVLGGGFIRAMAGMLLWGMTTVAVPVATMPAVTAVAADAEAHGQDEHGHGGHGDHVEIGHNPPAGVAKKDFESPAEFRSDLAIWSLAVFLLLLGLLGKFAWKPIMDGLDKREQGIEHQIAETKKANEEAKRMLVSYERRLAEATDEVRGMLDEARRDSEATKQAIVAEARKAADDEQARAKHEIGLARDEALSSIALKAGDLAVEVAGKFLREKIGKEDHSRLVRDSVGSLGTKPSVN
jgi:F-type H+-transporting ATPase subunit b